MNGRSAATVLHVDLDAFFAAVELLDEPSLRGKPVIVGGLGNRGVVSTASYEARRFGVRSAMPMARARKACPHAIFRTPRMSRYVEKSVEVMAILGSISPLVEQLSIDEAFVDVAGARRMLGAPAEIAAIIRRRVLAETGLTLSVGVASTKFLAKLGSELAKPDGVLVVEPGTEQAFLAPLPVSRLWGVGPATLTKLERMGMRTIGDVAGASEPALVGALGPSLGRHLHALAAQRRSAPGRARTRRQVDRRGGDVRRRPAHRRRVRTGARAPRPTARARRLRAAELDRAHRQREDPVRDFETRTRARTLPEPTDVSTVVLDVRPRVARASSTSLGGVRLLGVSLSQLDAIAVVQTSFDLTGDEGSERTQRTERRAAVEHAGRRSTRPVRLRGRYSPATLVEPGAQTRGSR